MDGAESEFEVRPVLLYMQLGCRTPLFPAILKLSVIFGESEDLDFAPGPEESMKIRTIIHLLSVR